MSEVYRPHLNGGGRDLIVNNLKVYHDVEIRGSLTIGDMGGNQTFVKQDLNEMKRNLDEMRTTVAELKQIVEMQKGMIDALWYNPGPSGPGAREASESYHDQMDQLDQLAQKQSL